MEPDSLQRFVIFVFCWFPVGILWCEVDAAMSRCYVVPHRKVLIHSEYGLAVCCFQHHRKFLSLVSLFASIHHDGVPRTVALFVVKLSVFSGNRLHREWLDRVDGSHYIHISCRNTHDNRNIVEGTTFADLHANRISTVEDIMTIVRGPASNMGGPMHTIAYSLCLLGHSVATFLRVCDGWKATLASSSLSAEKTKGSTSYSWNRLTLISNTTSASKSTLTLVACVRAC